MKPWMLPGPRHRGLTTMRTLFNCFCIENKEVSKELMVILVGHTLTWFAINAFYTPLDCTEALYQSFDAQEWGSFG